MAGQTEALQGAGVRGLVGGLGRVEAGNQMMNAQIAADLDQQQRQIDMSLAQDMANIRGMQEQREMQDIGALSSQYNAGQQMFMAGLGGIAQTGMSAASVFEGDKTTQNEIERKRREQAEKQIRNRPQIDTTSIFG
jgi:hypothetical protein